MSSEPKDEEGCVTPPANDEPRGQSHSNKLKRYFTSTLSGVLLFEIEVLLLAFGTGIMDATLFADYHVFASNQTGNTVFLAVGAFGLATGFINLQHTAISLGLFAAGGIILGQMGNYAGRKTRGWLVATNLFQSLLVLTAAAIQQWGPGSDDFNSAWPLGVIAPLAFASSGQVAVARGVSINEIPTTVVTSAYVDLFMDANLLAPVSKNRARNRRVLFILFLLIGAFVGAAANKHVSGPFGLLLTAICKLLATAGFFFNPPARE